MIFIDRINELKALNDRYDSGKAEFVVVYGRRRVGKTELLKQFMNNHDGIIFISFFNSFPHSYTTEILNGNSGRGALSFLYNIFR